MPDDSAEDDSAREREPPPEPKLDTELEPGAESQSEEPQSEAKAEPQSEAKAPAEVELDLGPEPESEAPFEDAEERERVRQREHDRDARRARSASLSWLATHRTLVMSAACVALGGVLVALVFVIVKQGERRGPVMGASSAALAPLVPSAAPIASSPAGMDGAAEAESEGLPRDGALAMPPGFEDYSDDGEPHGGKPTPPKRYDTVQQAALESCTTESVDALSRQIIAQARCIKPNAFVPLPQRSNLVIGSQVFPYLQSEARDQLLKALESRPNQKMTINSALRTVAQQYLVWRWSATKRCGVPLATPPGQSNHEIGIAIDIAEAGAWRATLEAHRFKWLGASDRVHFDYRRGAAPGQTATDVLAFQTLWNRNNPDDKIPQHGKYDTATEQRLKKAPAGGFKLGASCKR